MSMEMLNTLQFVELLCGYLGCTVLLPALVFYRKVKAFPAAGRFLIYFTIGNFYIINLVQVLELAYLSCRGTLLLFTLVPAGVAAVRIYQIPVGAYGRKLVQELRHFVRRELGFRSFVHHRLREVKRFLCFIGRQLVRLLKEVWPDLVFLAVFLGVLWKVCWPGILNNWGFGASDLPVHNYWINGLIDNKLYIAGIYPMGMHCMLYYLSTVLCIPAYAVLRLFWLIQYSMIAAVLLAFLKGCCKSRFLPWLGATGFVGLNCFNGITYSRFGATLPQEFGMIFILPALYFVVSFFRVREAELRVGVNRIRCTSTWLLLGFSMSFSLTLSSHFYGLDNKFGNTIATGFKYSLNTMTDVSTIQITVNVPASAYVKVGGTGSFTGNGTSILTDSAGVTYNKGSIQQISGATTLTYYWEASGLQANTKYGFIIDNLYAPGATATITVNGTAGTKVTSTNGVVNTASGAYRGQSHYPK